jgi:hypothetical protein
MTINPDDNPLADLPVADVAEQQRSVDDSDEGAGLDPDQVADRHNRGRRLATAQWVDWFNHRHLYEYCGVIPPVELERAYYAHHQRPVDG